ncbi:DUF1183 domain protein [Aspergillus clavatus NRRL 1]|uniref:Store-operated calcium entry-associated regulatory factor n=1 Tax=Aspergillus clavatus (strain ATCC 1007 / CBS 513.65 / DSM 816 / NCTC 3887 / NRRL 1 / QM 1276 / 107) TaxID=344612 RepID=A1CM87_ASPCL|nr:DUF1183 domain protein [Aspergillus clavatus NRRL 1]EAW08674.1 DUF1183 domain protein [Aspergillus clavatus NRRL 1]
MYYPGISSLLLCFLCLAPPALSFGRSSESSPARNAILLSRVQSLTLRANRLTSSRRVSPIPQLKCVGPSKRICDLYTIDTMRCTNAGHDYDEEDVQWTCTAPLPPEFKLGSTDVVCEGYRNADDKWVLKGSCGVEYRLLLTELGERRFGIEEDLWSGFSSTKGWRRGMSVLGDLIFFGFMGAVFILILWPMVRDCFGLRGRRGPNAGRGGGGFGGFGGGGGGGDDNYPGPPPPYSSCPSSGSFSARASAPGWRPGFWTGALGGAAAGYQLGRRNNQHDSPLAGRSSSSRWNYQSDRGESSSRSRSPTRFSATTTGTGFGSTRRR